MPTTHAMNTAAITALSHEGRGIARIDNKTIFIQGALPEEIVEFQYTKQHSRFDEGIVTKILKPSYARITPHCQYFGICGGCSLQHLSTQSQVQHKESTLLERLAHISHAEAIDLLPALQGEQWGYRHRARLRVCYHADDNTLEIGFLKNNSHQIVNIQSCPILNESMNMILENIPHCLLALEAKAFVWQIEITVTNALCAVGLYHTQSLGHHDRQKLEEFAQKYHCEMYCLIESAPHQKRKIEKNDVPEPNAALISLPMPLEYAMDKHQVRIQFQPTHFTQINPDMNLKMIDRAIELLETNSNDCILDLFCGVGNFTLPLARYAGAVVGVEGNTSAVMQAKKNAELNDILNAKFFSENLFKPNLQSAWAKGRYTKIIIDPPRAGAKEMIPWIATCKPSHIVYISCDTATLTRDIKLLLEQGYTLSKAGIMDMFPHTEHTEAIALLIGK